MSTNSNKGTIYNSSNILELIDALAPASPKQEHKLTYLTHALHPILTQQFNKPIPPTPIPTEVTSNFINSLKDSNNEGILQDIPVYLDTCAQIDADNYANKQAENYYKYLCDDYKKKSKEKENLLTSSSKYLKGYAGWGLILDYYPKSTHFKYLVEVISVSVSQYVKLKEKNEPIFISNFKKIIPEMVESYLIFGKSTLNFSKIVEDEIVVEDPTQIVNTSMLIFPNTFPINDQDNVYINYRKMGWKDWDPVRYVDVMRLPFLQEQFGLKTPKEIANNYSTYSQDLNAVSMRYELEHTIPVVGRKSIAYEKMKLLGGDLSFLMDNIYYLATLELIQSVLRTTIPLLNTWHFKDPAAGMSSLFENNNSIESEDIAQGLEDVTKEGSLPVITTTTNGEMRVNTVPLDHLPSLYLDIIRNLYTKWGQTTPEQQSSLKDSRLNSKKIEYLIENVLKFTYEKYLNVLVKKNKISEEERDKWLVKGIFNPNPRVDLRDADDFSGYESVVRILNNFEGLKLTEQSASDIIKATLGFDANFEKIENNDKLSNVDMDKNNKASNKKGRQINE